MGLQCGLQRAKCNLSILTGISSLISRCGGKAVPQHLIPQLRQAIVSATLALAELESKGLWSEVELGPARATARDLSTLTAHARMRLDDGKDDPAERVDEVSRRQA